VCTYTCKHAVCQLDCGMAEFIETAVRMREYDYYIIVQCHGLHYYS